MKKQRTIKPGLALALICGLIFNFFTGSVLFANILPSLSGLENQPSWSYDVDVSTDGSIAYLNLDISIENHSMQNASELSLSLLNEVDGIEAKLLQTIEDHSLLKRDDIEYVSLMVNGFLIDQSSQLELDTEECCSGFWNGLKDGFYATASGETLKEDLANFASGATLGPILSALIKQLPAGKLLVIGGIISTMRDFIEEKSSMYREQNPNWSSSYVRGRVTFDVIKDMVLNVLGFKSSNYIAKIAKKSRWVRWLLTNIVSSPLLKGFSGSSGSSSQSNPVKPEVSGPQTPTAQPRPKPRVSSERPSPSSRSRRPSRESSRTQRRQSQARANQSQRSRAIPQATAMIGEPLTAVVEASPVVVSPPRVIPKPVMAFETLTITSVQSNSAQALPSRLLNFPPVLVDVDDSRKERVEQSMSQEELNHEIAAKILLEEIKKKSMVIDHHIPLTIPEMLISEREKDVSAVSFYLPRQQNQGFSHINEIPIDLILFDWLIGNPGRDVIENIKAAGQNNYLIYNHRNTFPNYATRSWIESVNNGSSPNYFSEVHLNQLVFYARDSGFRKAILAMSFGDLELRLLNLLSSTELSALRQRFRHIQSLFIPKGRYIARSEPIENTSTAEEIAKRYSIEDDLSLIRDILNRKPLSAKHMRVLDMLRRKCIEKRSASDYPPDAVCAKIELYFKAMPVAQNTDQNGDIWQQLKDIRQENTERIIEGDMGNNISYFFSKEYFDVYESIPKSYNASSAQFMISGNIINSNGKNILKYHFITRALDKKGKKVLRSTTLRAKEGLKQMIHYFEQEQGKKIDAVVEIWEMQFSKPRELSDNYWTYQGMRDRGMSAVAAAKKNVTAKWLRELGFSQVEELPGKIEYQSEPDLGLGLSGIFDIPVRRSSISQKVEQINHLFIFKRRPDTLYYEFKSWVLELNNQRHDLADEFMDITDAVDDGENLDNYRDQLNYLRAQCQQGLVEYPVLCDWIKSQVSQ